MRYIVMCRRSGGPSGTAETPLKANGVIQFFVTDAEAQAKADDLMVRMNHPFAIADYRYWVERAPDAALEGGE